MLEHSPGHLEALFGIERAAALAGRPARRAEALEALRARVPGQPALQLRQARCELDAGAWADALALASDPAVADDDGTRVDARLVRLESLLGMARYGDVREGGLGLAGEAGVSPSDAARALVLASKAAEAAGDLDDATALGKRALALASDVAPSIAVRARVGLGSVASHRGAFDQAIELYERARRDADEIGFAWGVVAATANIANVRYYRGQAEEALVLSEEAAELAARTGDPGTAANILNNIGAMLNLLGQYERSLEVLQQALVQSDRAASRALTPYVQVAMSTTLRELGRPAEARDAAERAVAVAEEIGDAEALVGALRAAAMAHAQLSAFDAAWAAMDRCLELVSRYALANVEALCVFSAASLARESHDAVRARAVQQRLATLEAATAPVLHAWAAYGARHRTRGTSRERPAARCRRSGGGRPRDRRPRAAAGLPRTSRRSGPSGPSRDRTAAGRPALARRPTARPVVG